jgi:hypothetical protein
MASLSFVPLLVLVGPSFVLVASVERERVDVRELVASCE